MISYVIGDHSLTNQPLTIIIPWDVTTPFHFLSHELCVYHPIIKRPGSYHQSLYAAGGLFLSAAYHRGHGDVAVKLQK